MNRPPSLPRDWIDRVFTEMRATYGATFDRQWDCPAGADPVAHAAIVKGRWGEALAGFERAPYALRYGLDNLPEFPPTLPQFVALCRRAPQPERQRLAPPRIDPEMAGAAARAIRRPVGTDGKAWARNLRDREAAGHKLGATQRALWRAALGEAEADTQAVQT